LLFRKVTELDLRIDGERSLHLLGFLPTLIDLTHLDTIFLQVDFDHSIVSKIVHLVKQACNVRSLKLFPLNPNNQYNVTMAYVCSIVPFHVKHLTVKIKQLDDMKIVVNELKHLSSISFCFPYCGKINVNEMINWLIIDRRDFTYLETENSFNLWLGENRT
jgi:hypothetical protein